MAGFAPLIEQKTYIAEVWSSVPDSLRDNQLTAFAAHQNSQKAAHSFLEGPVVVDGKLYVVDIAHGRIFAIDLETKEWSTVVQYEGQPNGMAWHPKRKQLLIADRIRGLVGLDPNSGKLDFILESFHGQPFLGPNDLVVAADGSVVFTDQGMTGIHDPSGRVYSYNFETKKTEILLRNCPSPNGLLFDKAEKVLFVCMTRDNAVWHAPVFPDGNLIRCGRFTSYYGLGGPDGMTLDSEGNLFVCVVRTGIIFIHKADGTPLARILMPEGLGSAVTNLTWSSNEDGGDGEGDRLYITESTSGTILTVKWHCKGWLGKIYYDK